jgi:hypothetical protein
VLRKLFATPYFVVSLLPDPQGAEMCGTLKNIVALAAGMIDGLGLGPNSKATIMRQVGVLAWWVGGLIWGAGGGGRRRREEEEEEF